jgi:hypothetical protein
MLLIRLFLVVERRVIQHPSDRTTRCLRQRSKRRCASPSVIVSTA